MPKNKANALALWLENSKVSDADFAKMLANEGCKITSMAVGEWRRGKSYPRRKNAIGIEKVTSGVVPRHYFLL